jgi:hypothetical protein
VVLLVFLALAIAYVVLDGSAYMYMLWQKCRPKERVYPSDLLYDMDEPDHKSVGNDSKSEDETGEFNIEAGDDRPPAPVRAGLFGQQDQILLKEGQWRTIKRRVTLVRPLRTLHEMNRKFHIVAPLDTEVLDYEGPEPLCLAEDDSESKVVDPPENSPIEKARKRSIHVRSGRVQEFSEQRDSAKPVPASSAISSSPRVAASPANVGKITTSTSDKPKLAPASLAGRSFFSFSSSDGTSRDIEEGMSMKELQKSNAEDAPAISSKKDGGNTGDTYSNANIGSQRMYSSGEFNSAQEKFGTTATPKNIIGLKKEPVERRATFSESATQFFINRLWNVESDSDSEEN